MLFNFVGVDVADIIAEGTGLRLTLLFRRSPSLDVTATILSRPTVIGDRILCLQTFCEKIGVLVNSHALFAPAPS